MTPPGSPLHETLIDGVLTLWLDRPAARNALNMALCDALRQAAAQAPDQTNIHMVLIRARGAVFCAGADLKERQGMDEAAVRARRQNAFAAYAAIESIPKPVVAVVEGAAVGSGVEIAAACDFIVATPAASFRTPEALWGTVGATQRLPRILGKRLAKDLMFTGRTLSAQEALLYGFVTRLIPADTLESALHEMTQRIVTAPAKSLALAKRCIDQGIEQSPQTALQIELQAIEENLAGADWRRQIDTFGKAS